MPTYEPKFPKAHALLLEVYRGLMTAYITGAISTWAERFKSLVKAWETLDEEGLLPPLFTQHFWRDIQDVEDTVNREIDTGNLNKQQGALSFALGSLAKQFGAP